MGLNLKITGNGMTVDRDITLTQAGKIIAFLGTESELIDIPTSGTIINSGLTTIEQQPSSTRLSIREMMDEANPRTHAQRITVFGHYVAQSNPEGLFTSDEVKEHYQLAREKITQHFSREINKAISKGWIEPARSEKNTFFITRKGEDVITKAFNITGKLRSKVKSKATSSKSSAISENDVSEAVRDVQPIVPILEGFPGYHKLKTKGFKIMWLLAMAQAHDIDRLSTKELVFFTSKLRDKLAVGDINALTQTAAKNGWITKDNDANYFLLHDGEEHLKTLLGEEDVD